MCTPVLLSSDASEMALPPFWVPGEIVEVKNAFKGDRASSDVLLLIARHGKEGVLTCPLLGAEYPSVLLMPCSDGGISGLLTQASMFYYVVLGVSSRYKPLTNALL